MANIAKITVNSTDYDIKDAFSRDRLTWYGTSSTDASTTIKAVTCDGFVLKTGAVIAVKFTNTNTGAVGSLRLNVNSTGNKYIKYNGAALPSADMIYAGSTLLFVFDGSYYSVIGFVEDVKSVNGKTGAVELSASDVGAVASLQGSGNAGKFLMVNSSGIVEPVSMQAWQGGSY